MSLFEEIREVPSQAAKWPDPRTRDLEELPRQNRSPRRDPAPPATDCPILQSDGITLHQQTSNHPLRLVCVAWLKRHHRLLPLRVSLQSSSHPPDSGDPQQGAPGVKKKVVTN